MAIVINGSGTVTGLAVGGLPDGTVDAGTLATDSVVAAKLGTDAVTADALKSDAVASGDLPAGSVLQVVQTVQTGYEGFILNNTWADVAGMSVAITPSSTSSKVLISFNLMVGGSGVTPYPRIKLLKNSSDLIVGNATGSRVRVTSAFGEMVTNTGDVQTVSFEYLDSPSTTSATTYKLQVSGYNSRLFYVGITGGSDANSGMSTVSSITAKEIAG